MPTTFTLEQLNAAMTWASSAPWGLHATVAIDHEEIDEVLEIWRHDRRLPAYFLTHSGAGAIELDDAQGLHVACTSLGEALAWVDVTEAEIQAAAHGSL